MNKDIEYIRNNNIKNINNLIDDIKNKTNYYFNSLNNDINNIKITKDLNPGQEIKVNDIKKYVDEKLYTENKKILEETTDLRNAFKRTVNDMKSELNNFTKQYKDTINDNVRFKTTPLNNDNINNVKNIITKKTVYTPTKQLQTDNNMSNGTIKVKTNPSIPYNIDNIKYAIRDKSKDYKKMNVCSFVTKGNVIKLIDCKTRKSLIDNNKGGNVYMRSDRCENGYIWDGKVDSVFNKKNGYFSSTVNKC